MQSLPVISFSQIASKNPATLEQLKSILHHVGFFYLVDHGIEKQTIQELFHITKNFFLLSDSQKEQISIYKSQNYRGYSSIGAEKTQGQADFKETLDLGLESPSIAHKQSFYCLVGPNQWPDSTTLKGMKSFICEYMNSLLVLGDCLMEAIALCLKLPENYFKKSFTKERYALMRLIHYMGQTDGVRKIGVGEHTDFGCLVILLQDEIGGLEVQLASGEWIAAPPRAGSLVVNIGDMLALWTRNYFKATPHRVINTSPKDRYSIPFFYEPNLETTVRPAHLAWLPEDFNQDLTNSQRIYGEHMLAAFKRSFPEHPQSK